QPSGRPCPYYTTAARCGAKGWAAWFRAPRAAIIASGGDTLGYEPGFKQILDRPGGWAGPGAGLAEPALVGPAGAAAGPVPRPGALAAAAAAGPGGTGARRAAAPGRAGRTGRRGPRPRPDGGGTAPGPGLSTHPRRLLLLDGGPHRAGGP